jgi:hypothetical protein
MTVLNLADNMKMGAEQAARVYLGADLIWPPATQPPAHPCAPVDVNTCWPAASPAVVMATADNDYALFSSSAFDYDPRCEYLVSGVIRGTIANTGGEAWDIAIGGDISLYEPGDSFIGGTTAPGVHFTGDGSGTPAVVEFEVPYTNEKIAATGGTEFDVVKPNVTAKVQAIWTDYPPGESAGYTGVITALSATTSAPTESCIHLTNSPPQPAPPPPPPPAPRVIDPDDVVIRLDLDADTDTDITVIVDVDDDETEPPS